ncbi:MAG: DUF3540 domain-containing protein [Desulfovibrionaceae bacterium]|nr:DUF3540 domain-containing protein [Desulfovibrionaceae bacterium]
MPQAALSYNALEARLITGRVTGSEDKNFSVHVGNTFYDAAPAAGCLLEPAVNDIVLLARLENGANVILSVLFRDDTAPARLNLPADSAVHCPGRLALRAADSLNLESGRCMNLTSKDMDVAADKATASITRVNTLFDTAEFCCRALTSFGQNALSVFHSFTQCLGRSQRMVEGADETRCAESTLIASENATVMSKNNLTMAKDTSRTDARLIQLG